jgi:hypothetical protein
MSGPLREQALFWSNRLPYGDVSRLLREMTGAEVSSEDSIWRLVQHEAQLLDKAQGKKIAETACLPEPHYVAADGLYEADTPEFVAMMDGIGVKSQKPTRAHKGTANTQAAAKVEKRHDTDVLILPRPDGGEHLLCEGVSGDWSLVDAARSYLRQNYSGKRLCVVAVTDGARSIRGELAALFGENVRVILDWYHLQKRVYEQLAMAAPSRPQREEWQRQLLGFLWRGKVTVAQTLLGSWTARNTKALEALRTYLDNHATEIIDYQRRQEIGKTIGSGRMEKCVDQVIGHRQKHNGMSWTKTGSRALALLKVDEINDRHGLSLNPGK